MYRPAVEAIGWSNLESQLVQFPFAQRLIKAHVSLRFSLLSPFAKSLMPSIQSVHVHFPALLAQPPVDRVRKVSLVQLAHRYVTYTYH